MVTGAVHFVDIIVVDESTTPVGDLFGSESTTMLLKTTGLGNEQST